MVLDDNKTHLAFGVTKASVPDINEAHVFIDTLKRKDVR